MLRDPFDNLSVCDVETPPPSPGETFSSRQKAGYAAATAHHGELFQGVVEGPDGRLLRGLVSLPCDIFKSEAVFHPDASGVLKVDPVWKIKARKAVELTLAHTGRSGRGGTLRIRSTIPVGWGLGSSTSDVTAAIRAVADAFGERIEPQAIATLAVKAESASDSIMFGDRVVFFAQREGAVIEDLKGVLPGLEVLGFNTDHAGVDTLSHTPAQYTWWEVEAFRPLAGLLRRAVATQNPHLVGQVATASAHLNQQHLPKPHFESIKRVADRVGALGIQVAHSGTVVGLLFDAQDERRSGRIRDARRMVNDMGFGQTWRFRTGGCAQQFEPEFETEVEETDAVTSSCADCR